LGAEATFVARTIDSDRKHLTGVLRAAAAHRGTSLVEIYQNCPIFNDGAFEAFKDNVAKDSAIIPLTHGEPVRFGSTGQYGVLRDEATGAFTVTDVATDDDTPGVDPSTLHVHDAHTDDPSAAFGLSRLTPGGHLDRAPIGIFRQVERPTYDDLARNQIHTAQQTHGTGDLNALLNSGDTWHVA
ncbi:MAG: 2-oxoacid:ferredoxin oxidoreductase subunit beta, partial [Nocardioidaceae bacterium]